jgi:ubiquinone/menaquinone biosynthesis C-methylase UbiE
LWVAKETAANLIGIDISSVGVDLAREQAVEFGMADRASFQVGDLTVTGLPDESCDAVMSLDVLVFVPDKIVAVREFARILRIGGTLGFTTWEQSGYSPRLGAEQVADHRPLLEAAGFTMDSYQEPPEWRRQQTALAEGLIAAEVALAKETDEANAAGFAAMARGVLADMPARRYVCAIATKQ